MPRVGTPVEMVLDRKTESVAVCPRSFRQTREHRPARGVAPDFPALPQDAFRDGHRYGQSGVNTLAAAVPDFSFFIASAADDARTDAARFSRSPSFPELSPGLGAAHKTASLD
jgi:hypothetical protein